MMLSSCTSEQDAASAPRANVVEGSFKMLVYSRTAGYRHASIEDGIAAIKALGQANNFEVDATEDPTAFTDENLAQYDVVSFLNTTGDILDDTQQAAFERWVHAGGGWVGVHSAADGEYEWPFYGELVGAWFKNHPLPFIYWNQGGPGVQPGTFHVEAADHPAVAHLPSEWRISDEFYSFRTNPRDHVRVLMNIDESSYLVDPNTSYLALSPETGRMGDHPMSWCHDNLGGRAFYTNLGHSPNIYQDPLYLEHLLNGILTAARRVEANCTPGFSG